MGDIDYYIFALLLSNLKNLDNLVDFRAEEIDENPRGLLVVVLHFVCIVPLTHDHHYLRGMIN